MADGLIVTWEDQLCAQCDSKTFVQVYHLRVKPGGGTVPTPGGWECSACHARADMAEMQRLALLRQRRKEMQALEDEIRRSQSAAQPATSTTRAS